MDKQATPCINKKSQSFLTVIKQNGSCRIQDLGRMYSQHLGFSASGAADEYAFLYANYLLNSRVNKKRVAQAELHKNAQLEITLGQVTFKASQNCTIAITGADCNVHINNNSVSNWQVHQVSANDTISFGMPKTGLHSYLAVLGGIQTKKWLNSHSQTSTESQLNLNAETITEGTIIPLSNLCYANNLHAKNNITTAYRSPLIPSNFYNEINAPLTLRFIPQALWRSFEFNKQAVLCEHQFTISPNSNRMGYRLSEIPNKVLKISSLFSKSPTLSKPVTFGTIQLPSNNQPIVLMKERQTIGGYPVLGTVIQTDLFRLSQLRPGNKVRFIPTTLSFAQQQLQSHYLKFKL